MLGTGHTSNTPHTHTITYTYTHTPNITHHTLTRCAHLQSIHFFFSTSSKTGVVTIANSSFRIECVRWTGMWAYKLSAVGTIFIVCFSYFIFLFNRTTYIDRNRFFRISLQWHFFPFAHFLFFPSRNYSEYFTRIIPCHGTTLT